MANVSVFIFLILKILDLLNFSKILFTLVYFCISVLLFTSVGCAVKTKSTLSDFAT